jgi:oxygen-independent coproporphyrinogen-3 oxidase
LEAAGVKQYEISNFARPGQESRHNLKYWTRGPYFGFGVDAHSMLLASQRETNAVRFSSPDSLPQYVAGGAAKRSRISREEALEETFFLGLRLNRGLDLSEVAEEFGPQAMVAPFGAIAELVEDRLLERHRQTIRLTARGRLLSNEVFERFISSPQKPG